jgi:acid phosphatase
MHDCSVSTGDSWLRDHLDSYARWAREHNSLLVVTFDEDDSSADNRILTLVAGAGVRPGRYGQPVDHYRLLSTVEHLYGLTPPGVSGTAPPIADIWS